MPGVVINGVAKSFGTTAVLHRVDLSIAPGEFMVLVGPSGCGKSTLLRLVAGLEEVTNGTIEIAGKVVNKTSPKERGVAMVFQNYALYPHMTVFDNMAFALKLAHLPVAEIEKRVNAAAETLGLIEHLTKKPGQLSGGQKQRVAMGRAMVREPAVFLFDEPLSNLDAQLRVKMRAEISMLHRRYQTTAIYVTHDQVEAMTLADRIAVMHKGKLEQVGKPLEVYNNPKTKFVASFIGTPSMNFVPVSQVPSLRTPAKAFHVGFRPENTRLGELPGHFGMGQGKVTLVEPLGSVTHVHVQLGKQSVISEIKDGTIPPFDQQLSISVDERAIFFFDEQGVRL